MKRAAFLCTALWGVAFVFFLLSGPDAQPAAILSGVVILANLAVALFVT